MFELKSEKNDILKKDITLELTKLNSMSCSIESLYIKKYPYNDTLLKDEILKVSEYIDTKLISSTEITEIRLRKLREHTKFLSGKFAEFSKLLSISTTVNLNCSNPSSVYFDRIDRVYRNASKAFLEINPTHMETFKKNVPVDVLNILEDKAIINQFKNEISSLCKLAIHRLKNDDLRTAKTLKAKCDKKVDELISLLEWVATFRTKMHNIIFEERVKESEVRTKFNELTKSEAFTDISFSLYKSCEKDKNYYFNQLTYSGDHIRKTNFLDTLINDMRKLEDLIKLEKSKSKSSASNTYKGIFDEIFSGYGVEWETEHELHDK